MSRIDTPLPSRCAAMPSSAPMVTTPVPPTPVIRMPQGVSIDGSCASGSAAKASATAEAALPFLSLPPSMVTKLGQKPFTHEKSLLHEDWSIVRLRPNSVSTDATDMQFDCSEQSPQPSQTCSLII